ncbi:alanine:cation symporter family protein [Romboutsia sp. Marseille-P6047]|uniref:alanine:cation symporter family protein n=1 Tax=Romboutsia sp. Marseille-P6047 TaxID=2161817 RepID=UPI000822BA23|nr:alanine:cation symporter family protein [Romboutsia sp. Marseille-P6047]SCI32952.1 Na+/alanine symporter [uncultured Clostridium sp.]
MLHQLETIITGISDAVWPVFLPFMLIVGAFTSIRTIGMIQKKATKPAGLKFKNIIGPASISLGAMIGTGAIIGVLGALSKFSASGEVNVEAMAIWALLGACIMVPVSYSETLNSKIMGKSPKEYIGDLIHPSLGMVYAVCFVALAVFGFGGFQFSGIDSVAKLVTSEFMGMNLTLLQRYMFIVVPVIAVVAVLVLSKKHEIFMNAMTYMIGTAVAGYFIFFTLFVIKTGNYIPTYFAHIIEGMTNPVNGFSGIMLGFVLGMQKVLQTAETGLGALAMAAQEADTQPREAAMISLIPTVVTVVVSIVVTSYIASYGINAGLITFQGGAAERLAEYFFTAKDVTGMFGLVVLCAFTVLSALTTILGSYYYMTKLFKKNHINKNIAIYLLLIIAAGTLAVFGANVVFEAVDLLLFVLCGINVTALAIFTVKEWKKYQLAGNNDKKAA